MRIYHTASLILPNSAIAVLSIYRLYFRDFLKVSLLDHFRLACDAVLAMLLRSTTYFSCKRTIQ